MSSKEKIKPTFELADELMDMKGISHEDHGLLVIAAERLLDLHRYLGECRKTITTVSRLSTAVTGYLIMLDQRHEKPDDPVIKQMEWDALNSISETHPAARAAIRDLGISMLTTWKRPLWKIYEPEEDPPDE